MLFNSINFFIFLAIVYLGYAVLQRLGRWRWQNLLLLAASYVFYGAWDARFLFLITLSTTLDYFCGLMIDSGRVERRDRWKAGVFAVASAALFLLVDWRAIVAGEWAAVWRADAWAAAVVGGTAAACGAFGLAHDWLSRLDENLRRRTFVTASIVGNLAILGFFKYFDFFIDSAEAGLASFGLDPAMARLDIVLPVGISFYTFQTMSYTVDVYRRRMPATERLLDFGLYVAFFPQLVAGPIERAERLLPRFLRPRKITLDQTTRGLYLILFGLFQKVAIADGVARSVDSVYGNPGSGFAPAGVTNTDIAIATTLFAIQIYCDFAGYSKIARGVAKLFGIDLMTNFQRPYFAANPSEFWRRWHISLSTWLRDYLYIPLGGNRGPSGFSPVHVIMPVLIISGIAGLTEWVGVDGLLFTATAAVVYAVYLVIRRGVFNNLMLTMLLGGLWHGAAWNFVLWGFYQGLLLVWHRATFGSAGTRPDAGARSALAKVGWVALFIPFMLYGWLLFRAISLEQVVAMTGSLFGAPGSVTVTSPPTLSAIFGIPFLLLYEMLAEFRQDSTFYRDLPRPIRGFLYAILLMFVLIGSIHEPTQFIYFQF